MEKPRLDETKLKKVIFQLTGNRLPPKGQPLEDVALPEVPTRHIMTDLGSYLGKLHNTELQGYGYVDEENFNRTEQLRGQHKSFYDFWLEFFDSLSNEMQQVLSEEKRTGVIKTPLSSENRVKLESLLNKRPVVCNIILQNRSLFVSSPARLLNGNTHMGSIYVENEHFSGLADFSQLLLGDPINDLAYFSVMPNGEKYLPEVRLGWLKTFKGDVGYLDRKLHLYRLLEAYRKIFTRYAKYHYLEDYPEPLKIAEQELGYFTSV